MLSTCILDSFRFLSNHILLLVLTLSSLCSLAEEKPKEEKPFRRVMIGIHFSPDVAFRVHTSKSKTTNSTDLVSFYNEREIPKFGYCVGLNTMVNIKSFVGIETGVWYMNMGHQTKWQDAFFGSTWNGTSFDTAHFKTVTDFHYIGIPLKVNFTLGKSKFRFFAATGLAVNFLVNATNSGTIKGYPPENGKSMSQHTEYYNRVNIMPLAEAGIDYKINNRMNLKISPSFRFGVLDVNIPKSTIRTFLFNGGINVKYYFGI